MGYSVNRKKKQSSLPEQRSFITHILEVSEMKVLKKIEVFLEELYAEYSIRWWQINVKEYAGRQKNPQTTSGDFQCLRDFIMYDVNFWQKRYSLFLFVLRIDHQRSVRIVSGADCRAGHPQTVIDKILHSRLIIRKNPYRTDACGHARVFLI